jgi:hypothetical protein
MNVCFDGVPVFRRSAPVATPPPAGGREGARTLPKSMSFSRFTLPVIVAVLFALSVPELRRTVLAGAGLGPTGTSQAFAATPEPLPPMPAEPALDRVAERVEISIAELESSVAGLSHPDALRHAFSAYFAYRDRHPERVRKPYLYFVDFGLDSGTPRGYVFDMETLALVEGPFAVAHGSGSGPGGAVPTRFSNLRGSNATSLGLYLAQETYGFRGRSSGRAYASVGLRLHGVSGRFNSAARTRGIVVHGAPYVTLGSAGRSEGCPAMAEPLARRLLPRLANGGMVFHFSPRDLAWLDEDPWVNAGAGSLARGS